METSKISLHWCRRYAYEAMTQQNYVTAGRWCVRAIVEHGFQPEDCGNLAFIAFNHCSRSSNAAFYDRLVAANVQNVKHPAATFLRISFEIALAGTEIDNLVQKDYVNLILAPNIKNVPPNPILFWHIPKCSGTSLNEAFAQHFYGTRLSNVWPGYNYKPLVAYLLENILPQIPYASSVHLGMNELSPGASHFAFTSLRDPARRCYSMYRQEMAANRFLKSDARDWHNFRALPRYGEFWDYRNDLNFYQWVDNIPPKLLSRQLSTFSAALQIDEAIERISSLDYHFFRDINEGSEARLFELLGLEYASESVPSGLNRSDKSIAIPDDAEAILRIRLKKEFQLIDALVR